MTRKAAAALWHKARAWDRETRRPGRHGGVIGRVALDVYYALALDFQNFRTGRLDPSYDAIARMAGCCRRAAADAIAVLRDRGMLTWQRRCEEERDEAGRFRLRQRTNAYTLLPSSQWRGYRDNAPPAPSPDTLGAPERVPDPIEAAVAELTHGQRKAALAVLEADPHDTLALAFIAFYRAVDERESDRITGVQELPRNSSLDSNHINADRIAAYKSLPQLPRDDLETAKAHWLRVLNAPDKPS